MKRGKKVTKQGSGNGMQDIAKKIEGITGLCPKGHKDCNGDVYFNGDCPTCRQEEGKVQTIDLTPTPAGMVNSLLAVIEGSTSAKDRAWARQELIKAMTIAYARWYPEKEEYRIASPDTKVLMEAGTGKTAQIKDVQIPDLWHIAMWLKDSDGVRSKDPLVLKLDRYVDQTLKVYGQDVLDTWHIAHALKKHIMGVK
jgi:hypothetical protein